MRSLFRCLFRSLTRDVVFPPKILLHVRTKSSQVVVKVHNDMNKGVDDGSETSVAVGNELQAYIASDRHQAVMSHVEERDLIVLLSKNEEQSVKKVDKLENQVSISEIQEMRSKVLLLASPDIQSKVGSNEGNNEANQVDDDVEQIVVNHSFLT